MRELETRNGPFRAISSVNVAGMSYARNVTMKSHLHFTRRTDVAFTLMELTVVLAVGVLLFLLLVPRTQGCKATAGQINCVNNLKQIGLSFRIWAGDNGENYPMQVVVTNGGTMELVFRGPTAPHFAVMSNELGAPKILLCPEDKRRTVATNLAFLADTNISYFICLNATSGNPLTWLSGDRNITNRFVPIHGVLYAPTNSPVGWTEKLHKSKGNLCLGDGSVQRYTT